MEYEYRYLSEEKAAEIDAKGFVNNLGVKLSFNSSECVTNKKETIVFRQTWHSHEKEEPDIYFLEYNNCYFTIDIYLNITSKQQGELKDYYYLYNISGIYTNANKDEFELEGIVNILKDIVCVWQKNTLGKTREGDKFFVDVLYKGEGKMRGIEEMTGKGR